MTDTFLRLAAVSILLTRFRVKRLHRIPHAQLIIPLPMSGKQLVEAADQAQASPSAWKALGKAVQKARESSLE